MHDVNWWLMALAFVIGLVLTFALMIRKVTREVPITHTVSAAVGGAAAVTGVAASAAKVRGAAEKVHGDVQAVREKVHGDVREVAGKVHADVHETAAKVHGDVQAAREKVHEDVHTVIEKVQTSDSHGIIEQAPYGGGSIRVTRRTAAPAGYSVKGDKDTGRYFTVDSPDYQTVEAEVWFSDEDSAAKAGFLRWDSAAAAAGTAATLVSATDVPAGPYGKGSAKANADGSGPAGWTIKGNADSMLYHTTDSQWYGQTIAEVWFADEEAARAAGFLRWDTKQGDAGAVLVSSIAEVPAGPYGKGSAKANADGSGPAGWLIKGNADSMLFHGTDSPAYNETIAEVWFFDEATARAAGFDKWDKNFK